VFYSQNRNEQRQFLRTTWQKFLAGDSLSALEKQLASVIAQHPEYHGLIKNIEAEYFPEQGEVNPFLHINLHFSLNEQLSINQPIGILDYYQQLFSQTQDEHHSKHLMLDCLAQVIFNAQKNMTELKTEDYLNCLKKQCQSVG
jgi:hypothetical protein